MYKGKLIIALIYPYQFGLNFLTFPFSVENMPQPAFSDPRSYVRCDQTLPMPSRAGEKIDTRSMVNYQSHLPPKLDSRKHNYFRRLDQMKTQGFNAVKHEPYKGIGDPFYLDERKLILHALGQWDEKVLILSIIIYSMFCHLIYKFEMQKCQDMIFKALLVHMHAFKSLHL